MQMNSKSTLLEYLFTSTKYDVNYTIAKTLLEHLNELPEMSIDEAAFLAKTTPSSITKFCKKLGYVGFIEFKNNDLSQSTILADFEQKQLQNDYLKDSFDLINDLYQNAFLYFSSEDLKVICEKLIHCKKVAIITTVYGYTSSVYFSNLMDKYGMKIYIINRDSDDYSIQELYRKMDLIFIVSLTGKWIQKQFVNLNLDGNKTILLSYNYSDPQFYKTICFDKINFFFQSILTSSTSLQVFFVALASYYDYFIQNKK